MEGEEVLPDILLENILARVPFPYVFKARCLSKFWLAKLSPISSQEDEEKKLLATSFQKQVMKWSNTWQTFCPLFLDQEPSAGCRSMAYNPASQTWQEMSSLCWIRKDMRQPWRRPVEIEGPLLYGFVELETKRTVMKTDFVTMVEEIWVANLLTRTWKQLPSRRSPSSTNCDISLVIDKSLQTYKLILFGPDIRSYERDAEFKHFDVQIYNSRSDSWISNTTVLPTNALFDSFLVAKYFDGILYIADIRHHRILLAVNIEDGTVSEIRLSLNNFEAHKSYVMDLVVCNNNLLMIVESAIDNNGEWNGEIERVRLLKVDFKLLRLSEVARAPANFYPFRPKVISSGNCIFFLYYSRRLVTKYNVDEDEWSTIPISAAIPNYDDLKWGVFHTFQPGLSPFLEV